MAVVWRAKKFGAVALKSTKLFSGTKGIANFYNGIHGKDSFSPSFSRIIYILFFSSRNQQEQRVSNLFISR
jgi:hypothetical protein